MHTVHGVHFFPCDCMAAVHLTTLPSQAITCYTHALSPSPSGDDEDDSVLVNRAIGYVMLGDTDRALQDLDRASESAIPAMGIL